MQDRSTSKPLFIPHQRWERTNGQWEGGGVISESGK